PRRAAPVEPERERQPARLRTQLLLTDVVRPAAPRLTNAPAHHQPVDDAAIVHVTVVPVVPRRADDDHGSTAGLLVVERELARNRDDLVAGNAGDGLGPRRRVGHVLVIALGDMLAAEATVDAVVGDEEVVDGGDEGLSVGELDLLDWNPSRKNARMVRSREVIVLYVAEVVEGNVG